MDGVGLAAIIAVVAGYASSIYFIVGRIDTRLDRMDARLDRIESRLERVEERLSAVEVTVARIDQRLTDHVIDH